MKNVTQLRKELAEVFADLKSGKLAPATATEMNNAAGKMIATAKLQLEHATLSKQTPNIEWLKE